MFFPYRKVVQCFSPLLFCVIIRSHTNPSFVCHTPYILVHCCYGRTVFQKSLWTFISWSTTSVTRGWGIELLKVSKSYFKDTPSFLKISWDNSCFPVGLSCWRVFSVEHPFRQLSDLQTISWWPYNLLTVFSIFALISRFRNDINYEQMYDKEKWTYAELCNKHFFLVIFF